MTGFARSESALGGFTWFWELKSVNAKALDIRFRLPTGFDTVEAKLKTTATAIFQRGTISVTLTASEAGRAKSLKINQAALDQALALFDRLRNLVPADPPRLDGLLALPGVIEFEQPVADEDEQAAHLAAVTESFAVALDALLAARREEGARIAAVLGDRLDEIGRLIEAAETSAALQPDMIRARFAAQLERLKDAPMPLPPERLAPELALLVQKADVREELDRLQAHLTAARALLASAAGVGRRLDFLCQEFNREANTLCSKSADLGLTRIGLDLKASIEQFREQVQNVE